MQLSLVKLLVIDFPKSIADATRLSDDQYGLGTDVLTIEFRVALSPVKNLSCVHLLSSFPQETCIAQCLLFHSSGKLMRCSCSLLEKYKANYIIHSYTN